MKLKVQLLAVVGVLAMIWSVGATADSFEEDAETQFHNYESIISSECGSNMSCQEERWEDYIEENESYMADYDAVMNSPG